MRTDEITPSSSEILQSLDHWLAGMLYLIWAYRVHFSSHVRHALGPTIPSRIIGIATGTLVVTYEKLTIRGNAGDWLFLPRNALSQDIGPDTKLVSVAFASPQERSAIWNASFPRRIVGDAPQLAEVIDQIERFSRSQGSLTANCGKMRFPRLSADGAIEIESYLIRLQAILHRSVAECIRQTPPATDPRILQIASFLESHARQGFPATSLLSRLAGVGWRRIEQVFQKQLGQTPKRYHENARLQASISELAAPDMSIKAVAFRLGFSSSERFSSWFRRLTGLGPREFRNKKQVP